LQLLQISEAKTKLIPKLTTSHCLINFRQYVSSPPEGTSTVFELRCHHILHNAHPIMCLTQRHSQRTYRLDAHTTVYPLYAEHQARKLEYRWSVDMFTTGRPYYLI